MRLFKKKEVPEELPNLALDEITKKAEPAQEEIKYKPLPTQNFSIPQQTQQAQQFQQIPQQPKEEYKKLPSSNNDIGYFKELINNVTSGIENPDKINSWYKNKFMPEDIVFQMREYWEKQQPQLLLKNIRGDIKNKLMEKTERLHQLEKEWQQAYFDLLSKEEEIRKEEKELKESLSEFMSLFKKAAGKEKKKAS